MMVTARISSRFSIIPLKVGWCFVSCQFINCLLDTDPINVIKELDGVDVACAGWRVYTHSDSQVDIRLFFSRC